MGSKFARGPPVNAAKRLAKFALASAYGFDSNPTNREGKSSTGNQITKSKRHP